MGRAFAAHGYFDVIARLTRADRTKWAFEQAVARSSSSSGALTQTPFTEDPSLLYSWAHAQFVQENITAPLESDFNRAEALFEAQAQKLANELRLVNMQWLAAKRFEEPKKRSWLDVLRTPWRNYRYGPELYRPPTDEDFRPTQSAAELEARAKQLSALLQVWDKASRMIGSQGTRVHEVSVAQVDITAIMADLEGAEKDGLGVLAQVAQGLLQKLPVPDPTRPRTERKLIDYHLRIAEFARERLCAAAFRSEADRARFGEAAAFFSRATGRYLHQQAASLTEPGAIDNLTKAFECYDDAYKFTDNRSDHDQALELRKVVGDILGRENPYGATITVDQARNIADRIEGRGYQPLRKHAGRTWGAGGRYM